MPQLDEWKPSAGPAPCDALAPSPSVITRVLASLPAADQQRSGLRRRRQRQTVGAVLLGTLILMACIGPETSNLATRSLAWLYAADVAWKGLVSALLGGFMLLPAASALCLLGVSFLLWHRLLYGEGRGL